MVKDIKLEQLGVDSLRLRSQEHTPVSGRVPEKCPFIFFFSLGIERSVNMVVDITVKPLGLADIYLRSQEVPPISIRVPDKCLDLSF